MTLGRDLSAQEQAAYDARQAAKTSLMAQLSTTFSDAFGTTSQRRGAYVPTLAELAEKAPQPTTNETFVQKASLTTASGLSAQPAVFKPQIATTTVSDPQKMAAVLNGTAENEIVLKKVTANRVNVRSGPSTSHEVLGQVVHADIVQIISSAENGWIKISVEGDGVEGYMAAKFLTELTD
ncbi:SH3 domain-containing protein [Celeribacter sp. ULVN23_4]